ncbi:MAG: lipocalin family protein [Chlorobiaceae bacterium]|nr:lipocalin family protein [Chlorobiaceae bacterium]NTW63391.1 lipocalin family protein [Chlorobiaceae bacterium]
MFSRLFGKKTSLPVPETVAAVDVARYCGTWYEIASFPSRQQKRCMKTKAEYTLSDNGTVAVRNSCSRGRRTASIKAVATAVPDTGNAKLKVLFFGLFKADYWVIDLAPDYSWAAVSNPAGSRLWLLSRTPYMAEPLYLDIIKKLASKGLDISKLSRTVQ